jgi:ABC-type multidrug transport system fused ATPase/permease subunit
MGDPIQGQRKRLSEAGGRAMNLAAGVFTGIGTVKSFGLEDEMNRAFAGFTGEAYEQAVKTEKINSRMNVVKQVSALLQITVLFVMGTFLVSRGLLSLGDMLSFIAVSSLLAEALGDMDRMVSAYNQALARRLYEVFDIPPEEEGTMDRLETGGDAAVFENLNFSYDPGKEFFKGINIRLGGGQKVGIIGPSGCGKSTLVKLICGFYRPAGGRLRLFGESLENIRLAALRRRISLVSQEPGLFNDSIYENIRYGRIDASEKEILQAVEDTSLSKDLALLPQGIHTPAGEFGGRLSGGQRQRVSIARSLLKDAPLVILDEATSALDTKTEAEVQEVLASLLKNRAALVAAHRLTAAKNLDYIYCMENGRIVEEGSPPQLLAAKGYYYDMCRRQGLFAGTANNPCDS